MSVSIAQEVISYRGFLPANGRHVLLVMALRCYEQRGDRRCKASSYNLADESGLDRKTVRRQCETLVACGFVQVSTRHGSRAEWLILPAAEWPTEAPKSRGATPLRSSIQETIQERGRNSGAKSNGRTRAKTRASPLPQNWTIPDPWKAWAREARPDLSADELDKAGANFRDHYASTGGRRADWFAAWRLWIRREHKERRSRADAALDVTAQILERANDGNDRSEPRDISGDAERIT